MLTKKICLPLFILFSVLLLVSPTTAHAVPNAPTSLTATAVSVSQIDLSWTAPSQLSATGGSIVNSSGYKIHTFTSSSSFVVTGSGTVEYLVVAGGGGGGSVNGNGSPGGGGGGGGQHRTATGYSVSTGSYTVTVGGGGGTGSGSGSAGGSSVFDTITSSPGAGGIAGLPADGGTGGASGSGSAGGAGNSAGGGGGGNGGVGAASSGTTGGAGGSGTSSSITGSSVCRAGGGGGGSGSGSGVGSATCGGGAGTDSTPGTPGTSTTGGGGGGDGYHTPNGSGYQGGAGGSGLVVLKYYSPSITGYKIEYKIGAGSWSTLVADTGSTSTTYSATGLNAGTLYTFRVSAIDQDGTGSASNEASDTTFTPTPSAPLNPSALTTSTTGITLSWDTPTDAINLSGYKIFFETPTGNGFGVLVADTGSTSTTYPASSLTPGSDYNFMIAGINATGTGTNSTQFGNFTINSPATLTKVNALNSTAFQLFYSSSGTFNGIKIELESPVGAGFTTNIANTSSTGLSYVINGTNSLIDYVFRIYLHNLGGTSAVSNEVTNATGVTSAPVLNTVSSGSGLILIPSWTAPVNGTATTYIVQRSPSGCLSFSNVTTSVTTTSYSDTPPDASTVYCYAVFAVNGYGISSSSNYVNATSGANPPPSGGGGGTGGVGNPVDNSIETGELLLSITPKTSTMNLGETRTFSSNIIWDETKEYTLYVTSVTIGSGSFDSLVITPEILPLDGKKITKGKGEVLITVNAPTEFCSDIQQTARCLKGNHYTIPVILTLNDITGTSYPDIKGSLTINIIEKFPIGTVVIVGVVSVVGITMWRLTKAYSDSQSKGRPRKADSIKKKHDSILKKVRVPEKSNNSNILKKIRKDL